MDTFIYLYRPQHLITFRKTTIFLKLFYLVIIDISRYFHYVVVAIQSNIALLVFLRQLCIAYLYATKVVRASLIVYRQFSYKKYLASCKVFSFVLCFPATN